MSIYNGSQNRGIVFSSLKNRPVAKYLRSSLMILFFSALLNHALDGQDTISIRKDQEARKEALKLDFLSLGTGSAILTYERSMKPFHNLEFSFGIIGLGIDSNKENPSGILLKGGYKMLINNENFGRKFNNFFQGLYVKLEIDYANYTVESRKDFFDETEKYRISKYGFLIVTGYQVVIDGKLLIDPYLGVGVGANNLDHIDWSWPYGFMTGSNTFHSAFSLGVRIGFCY